MGRERRRVGRCNGLRRPTRVQQSERIADRGARRDQRAPLVALKRQCPAPPWAAPGVASARTRRGRPAWPSRCTGSLCAAVRGCRLGARFRSRAGRPCLGLAAARGLCGACLRRLWLAYAADPVMLENPALEAVDELRVLVEVLASVISPLADTFPVERVPGT